MANTGFYAEKKRALQMIDEMIKDSEPIQKIYYKIETVFGFGEKFVDKRINRLKELTKVISNVPE